MNKIATILLFVNFITVLFPQPGYIHPDEFLQSSEVVSGDVLGVSHFRAWEFNSTFPVRSILFPYLVISPSLYLLRWLNSTSVHHGLQLSAVKVVMATRLPTAFLSVFGFLATDRLAKAFLTNSYLSCVIYCSSYVTWTYYTRTFSNSIESVLLAIVLILSLPFSTFSYSFHKPQDKNNAHENKVGSGEKDNCEEDERKETDEGERSEKGSDSKSDNEKEEEKNTALECGESKKKRLLKKSKIKSNSTEESGINEKDKETNMDDKKTDDKETKSPATKGCSLSPVNSINIKNCSVKFTSFALGFVIVAGIFNRPTFLVFAFMPVVFWIWNVWCNCGREDVRFIFFMLFFSMGLGTFMSFFIFVFVDTVYYNPQFVTGLSASFQALMENNFSAEVLKETLQTITSSLVVTPWNFVQYNIDTSNLAHHGLHPRFTHLLVNLPLLLGPLYIPFIIVSLISVVRLARRSKNNLTIWLTFMAFVPILGLSVFPHQEPRFLIPLLPILIVMGTQIVAAMAAGKISFFSMWALFNILLTLVYGYMHQAALIPAMSIYQQKLSSLPSQPVKNYHAVFYKTYPPPRHMLLLDPDRTHITVTDLAGAPQDTLIGTVKDIKSSCQEMNKKCDIFIFMPSTVTNNALDQMPHYKISITSICPHLSMEAPPRFMSWWKKRLSFDDFITDFCLNIFKIT